MEKNTCRPYFCNIFALIFGCTAIFAGIESAIAETISMFTPRPDTLISGLKANAAASKLQTGKIIWKDKKSISMSPAMEQNSIYWYERRAKKRAWRAMDEIAVFPERGKLAELDKHLLIKQIHDRAVITEETDFVIYLKAPEPIGVKALAEKLSSLRAVKHVRQASPVFYPSREKTPGTRMVLTGQIIVQFPQNYSQGDIAAIEKEYGLERLKSYGFTENTFLYDGGNPLNSLGVANRLYESGRVNYSYPDWLRFRAKEAIPNDSFFPDQWHLLNTGQGGGIAGEDIDISSVWDTYTGSTNEVIAIYDDGLEIGHEDLSPNIISGLSWDYVDDDSDPTAGEHGTSCAGVAAGRGFNAMGVTGACPFCGLVGLRANDFISDAIDAEALTYRNQTIDIYNNSWGPRDLELAGPGPLVEDALSSGTTNGRGGLGSIFVWAVGNAGNDGDNSNYNGYANSRYTIAIAASTNYGAQSSYSEKGANIQVNAPSNGGSLGIVTTDRTGILGYNSGNYTSTFGGTSSAAPLVSGVIALMLEANPDLTWRDVQHILIETAEENDPTDADWTSNGGGFHINHKYGFGRINAQAAVSAALSWAPVGPETSAQDSSSPNLAIPDNDTTGVTDTIHISADINIEYVEIYFTAADHTFWGDLEITLASPEGTDSVLAEQHLAIVPGGYDDWRFGVVRLYGESSLGDWALTVKDLASLDTGTFQSWIIVIYGTSHPAYVGVFRDGTWFLDLNGNGHWDGQPTDWKFRFGGLAGDIPVTGDWDGTGTAKAGIYRDGTWFLDLNGNGHWDGQPTDWKFRFGGVAGDISVTGDWDGTGTAKAGIYRDGTWFLDLNGNGQWDGQPTDSKFRFGGVAGDIPITGDWDGTGTAKAGIYRDGTWFLDLNGNGHWDGQPTDSKFRFGGVAGDIPVTGDWDGTGTAKAGIYRDGTWFLDLNGNGHWDGQPTDSKFRFGGLAGDLPLIGAW